MVLALGGLDGPGHVRGSWRARPEGAWPAMASATPGHERPASGSSARLVAAAAALIAVGGAAFLGAGGYGPSMPPAVEIDQAVSADATTTTVAEAIENDTTDAQEPDELLDVNETATHEAAVAKRAIHAAASDAVAGAVPGGGVTDGRGDCTGGSHGADVTDAAHATPSGNGHGATVSSVATADCGQGPVAAEGITAGRCARPGVRPVDR